ncbi:MAG TPA: hypothetical protein VKK79_15895 [Candidatus Lokiarchaeia archaeon]|nr:hypothetical protein [Candidatus Lokiarchaeia archaeon]
MSQGQATCRSCGRDYSENLFSLLYCLTCDLSVCDSCISRGDVETNENGDWKCPSCGRWLTVKESRLFGAKEDE